MAQAVVNIAGRTYRMNCEDGEEGHIENLARIVEGKIDELRGAFGEIGEQRIVVMAALTLADELHAAREEAGKARAEAEQARDIAAAALGRQEEWAQWAAKALDQATTKVSAATKALSEG